SPPRVPRACGLAIGAIGQNQDFARRGPPARGLERIFLFLRALRWRVVNATLSSQAAPSEAVRCGPDVAGGSAERGLPAAEVPGLGLWRSAKKWGGGDGVDKRAGSAQPGGDGAGGGRGGHRLELSRPLLGQRQPRTGGAGAVCRPGTPLSGAPAGRG